MARGLRFVVAGLFVLLLVAYAVPSKAQAAAQKDTGTSGGVTISPAFQQINIDHSQPSKSFDFSLTNNGDQSYEVALSVVDFGSLDETGGVLFIGSAQKELSYKYNLSPWVTLEQNRVVLDPHSTTKVPVTIVNKESLAPGGHYGAILVSPTDSDGNIVKKVQINQVISSLLFVTKLGGQVYGLNLSKFTVRPHIFGLPSSVDLRFQDPGNVHVIPRGLALLTDPRGHIVKRGVVNADSGIVLPETFRSLNVPLLTVGKSWLPGRYKLSVVYRYDDQTATKIVSTSFLYLNVFSVLIALVIVAVAGVLILSKKLRHKLIHVVKNSLQNLRNLRKKRP